MLLPNPDRAVIDPAKLHGYLLSTIRAILKGPTDDMSTVCERGRRG